MIALIADIHANLPALEAVLADIEQKSPGARIISMGDIAGYHPMINECIDLLRSQNVENIMGNHDHYLVNDLSCGRSKSVDIIIDYQRSVITRENLTWLGNSELEVSADDYSIVHGGWRRSFEEYLYKLSPEYFTELPFTFFFAGHTHVQCLHRFENGKVFCNPGSVGQPRDGDSRAAYALFDGRKIQLVRVEYDISNVQKTMSALGFDEHLYKNLENGTRVGGKVDAIRVSL